MSNKDKFNKRAQKRERTHKCLYNFLRAYTLYVCMFIVVFVLAGGENSVRNLSSDCHTILSASIPPKNEANYDFLGFGNEI